MSSKIYLPGLNGFRAIAAMAVVFSHINLNLEKFGLPNMPGLQSANFGVTIFFTLSGFLITYLLLKEKESAGEINVKKFYVRRILRIWPLYFLYLTIVLLYIGIDRVNSSLIYYVFFTPNIPFVIGATLPFLAHYWSLGVEEQFYLFWPLVVDKITRLRNFLIAFVVLFLLLKVGVKFTKELEPLGIFLHYTRFGCMAIGALGAWYLLTVKEKLSILYHPVTEIAAWLVLVIVFLNRFHLFSIIDHELIALVSVVLILKQVSKDGPVFSLERNIFDFLGRISFGMYVFNPLIIDVVSGGAPLLSTSPVWLRYVLIYTVTTSVIIGVAYLSFRFFEEPFLRIKERFMVIKSSGSKSVKGN